jgi:arsenate reductase (thioredoxin)
VEFEPAGAGELESKMNADGMDGTTESDAGKNGRKPEAASRTKRRVLILCTGNSCRSQMAEGILRRLGGTDYEVYSAGTHPAEEVHPLAIEVMRQAGIDISHQRPKHVNELLDIRFHRVITVCDSAKEECPFFPGAERIHWPFDDPAQATGTYEERLKFFQVVRREIRTRLELWLEVDRRRPDLTPTS